MSMVDWADEMPTNLNPPVESISSLDLPLLKPEAACPKRSGLGLLASLAAASNAKSKKSPGEGVPLLVTVRLNCTGLPQSVAMPEAGLHSVPEVDEPVTTHWPPE